MNVILSTVYCKGRIYEVPISYPLIKDYGKLYKDLKLLPPLPPILWLRVCLLRAIATGDLELNVVVVLVCIYVYIHGAEWYVRNYIL